MGESESISTQIWKKTRMCPLFPIAFIIVLKALAGTITEDKKIKGIEFGEVKTSRFSDNIMISS